MKLAILGYGVEGKNVEKYFKSHPYENVPPENIKIKVFDKFKNADLDKLHLEDFDVIFRSPSVRPAYDYKKHNDASGLSTEEKYLKNKPYWTSATKYFFDHCPCDIISVSGTKGKGTTCSMITSILESIYAQTFPDQKSRPKVFLVGNIGTPALDVLDKITELDEVVYEMSSFQLWDLHKGSNISVLLRIEPDHLDVHEDFSEYVSAKENLTRYKTPTDHLIFYSKNPVTSNLAEKSLAKKYSYPLFETESRFTPELSKKGQENFKKLLELLNVPGEHNAENLQAALLAVSAKFGGKLDNLLTGDLYPAIKKGVKNFKGLPHRLEFVRELNGVKYYDDNYSSALPAMDVAIKAFKDVPVVLIAGGKNRNLDYSEHKATIFGSSNVKKTILIGEIKEILARDEDEARFEFAETLEDAVEKAKDEAERLAAGIDNCLTDEKTPHEAIVLMSPGAASFDMFDNFTDRGEKFQKIVKGLK